eukprot:2601616-Prymnesium_polylepis.1
MSYPLLRQHGDSGNPLAGKGGCTYYSDVKDHLLTVTDSEAVHAHDASANVMTLFLTRSYNPLVESPTLLSGAHPNARDFAQLLDDRL